MKYEREREQFKSEEKRKRIQQEPTILQTLKREKMVMSNGVGVGAIVIGCTLLVLTFISVVCGGVAMGKMTSPAAVSIGLWGFYVSTQKYFEWNAGWQRQGLGTSACISATQYIAGVVSIIHIYQASL